MSYARYQGEKDLAELALRVYGITDPNSDRAKRATQKLSEANPRIAKMEMERMPKGTPLVVPRLDDDAPVRSARAARKLDRIEQAREMLGAMQQAIGVLAERAEVEVKINANLRNLPQVARTIESANLTSRVETARVSAEAEAKRMNEVRDQAVKAVDRLTKGLAQVRKRVLER